MGGEGGANLIKKNGVVFSFGEFVELQQTQQIYGYWFVCWFPIYPQQLSLSKNEKWLL